MITGCKLFNLVEFHNNGCSSDDSLYLIMNNTKILLIVEESRYKASNSVINITI